MKTTHRNGDEYPAGSAASGVFAGDPLPWYRSSLATRVPPRYRKTRIAAHVVFGAGKALRRGTVTTVRFTSRTAGSKVRSARQRRKERREDPEWQYGRRFGGAVFLCAPCRQKFPSARLLNDHFVIDHLDEGWASDPKPEPARPKRKPSGDSKRAKTGKKSPTRDKALDSAYRKHADKIGVKAMNETTAARMVRAAGRQMSDASPQSLTELREQVLGMEKALGVLREGLEDYSRTLRSAHGRREGLASEVVNPYFGKATGGLEATERALSAFIFHFEDAYGAAIAAAARGGHGGINFIAS